VDNAAVLAAAARKVARRNASSATRRAITNAIAPKQIRLTGHQRKVPSATTAMRKATFPVNAPMKSQRTSVLKRSRPASIVVKPITSTVIAPRRTLGKTSARPRNRDPATLVARLITTPRTAPCRVKKARTPRAVIVAVIVA